MSDRHLDACGDRLQHMEQRVRPARRLRDRDSNNQQTSSKAQRGTAGKSSVSTVMGADSGRPDECDSAADLTDSSEATPMPGGMPKRHPSYVQMMTQVFQRPDANAKAIAPNPASYKVWQRRPSSQGEGRQEWRRTQGRREGHLRNVAANGCAATHAAAGGVRRIDLRGATRIVAARHQAPRQTRWRRMQGWG